LPALQAAGERGCTPIDHPGPRWSGYVHDLRKLGLVIETKRLYRAAATTARGSPEPLEAEFPHFFGMRIDK